MHEGKLENRENASKTSHRQRRFSSKGPEGSQYCKYKERVYKHHNLDENYRTHDLRDCKSDASYHQKHDLKEGGIISNLANFYIKNSRVNENELLMKSMNYLERKGIVTDKANKRYYRDNNLAKYLKVDRKQCLCHQMRIGDQQLRVRYPKNMNSHYFEEYEKKRCCVGGKCEVLNRDKEKRYFKAEPILMKTSKQIDYTGEYVPNENVRKSRPATSYGPFISSTSYGNTFQRWNVNDSYVPILIPKTNLQSSTNVPFKAVSAYRDTYRGKSQCIPGTVEVNTKANTEIVNNCAKEKDVACSPMSPNKTVNGKNHAQKSQISILSSPGNNKTRFMYNTTNRSEFRGQKSYERAHPIKHSDNLGAINLAVDPQLYYTCYKTEFNKFDNPNFCKRDEERILVRRELKQLQ